MVMLRCVCMEYDKQSNVYLMYDLHAAPIVIGVSKRDLFACHIDIEGMISCQVT